MLYAINTEFYCNCYYYCSCIKINHVTQLSWRPSRPYSPRAIVQVQIYLWQLSYSTECIYVAFDLEILFSRLTSVEWETNRGKKKMHVKEGGVPEHTHRLCNRHGPMVAQRCLGAKTNSPRKFTLVSCFELPKRTWFRPDFVRNDVISVRSSISFEVYRGLYWLIGLINMNTIRLLICT